MRSRPGSGALIGLLSVVACSPPPRSGAERARATTAIEGGSASDRAVDGTSGPVTTHAARPEATAGGVDPIDGGDGIDAAFLRRHTAALSDDSMEGRRPGTPGGARAVAYIVAQMQALGLRPAGEDAGWTQSVPMRAVRLDPARSTVGLRSGSDREPESLILGEQIMAVAMGPTGTTRVDAPLVFVGYGVTAPRFDWDDYGELDLRGKIAVVLVGDPPVDDGRFDGLALTEYGRWTYKLRRAEDAGASGCLLVHETKAASYDWTVVRSSWSGERYALREPEGPPEGLPMYGWIHQQLAERLAGLDGRTLADWHAMAIDPKFSPVDLPARLSATLTTTERALSDVNVLGSIPGRSRSGEVVVVTAHWDHLGVDSHAAPGQDAIFNGAIDNASGLAGLLGLGAELRAAAAQGRGPDRSVLLLATTAEEQGLLGSRYFVEHPLVPLSSIVAAANLDSMHVHGRTSTISVTGPGRTSLEAVLAEVAEQGGRTVSGDPHPGAGGYFRSDHFSFAAAGVPAIDFRGGPSLQEGGRAAGEALARRVAQRYHTVDDEFDPAWSFAGTLQDVVTLRDLVLRVANAERWPQWNPGRGPSVGGTPAGQ